MQDYRKLHVWRRSHRFVVAVYGIIADFPREERFELTAQLRRALVSIPTNIAEGRSRNSEKSFAAFVDIASGSAAETEYLLLLAHEVGYIGAEAHAPLAGEIDEIRRMLHALHAHLARSAHRRPLRGRSTLTANG